MSASQKLIIALYRAQRRVQQREMAILEGQSGLTFGQFQVLEVLYHRQVGAGRKKGPVFKGLTVSYIIQKTLSTIGNISVVLTNLERAGFIKKQKDPEDRRVTRVRLTRKGIQKMEVVWPLHRANLEEITAPLSLSEKKNMIRLLSRLRR